ncbi:MAG: stage II sporulation protein M [Planctomycetes bacterium]|nr:stage II sporulation protein M [Planctomycetota bacterium]
MKVVQLLEKRQSDWRALEDACTKTASINKSMAMGEILRFAALYRAACADLALADAYQLPANTIQYLHQLVGRAHNQLYRSRKFLFGTWLHVLFVEVPRRMFDDWCLRIAFLVFWGLFIACGVYAYYSPEFTETMVGKDTLNHMEEMYGKPVHDREFAEGATMSGFYLWNNAGIGLQCFAGGLLFGVGGLLITVSNAAFLGTIFGHMAKADEAANFYEFVMAHGPFELTAIVLSAGAGMRLGLSFVKTGGLSRRESLRRSAQEMVPVALCAVILFGLAGLIEAFISPSALPVWAKAGVMIACTVLLIAYFFVLGYPRGRRDAT